MDDRFAALAEWHDFFAAVAGVAATLVGLLFVALALNPRIMADASPAGLRIWAAQTFHDFLTVLVVALIVLIPDAEAVGLGVPLLLLGFWAWRGWCGRRGGCAATRRRSGTGGGCWGALRRRWPGMRSPSGWAFRCCSATPTPSAGWWPRFSC